MIREALDAALAFSLTGENVHNIIEKKNEILRGGDDIHAIVVINTMHDRSRENEIKSSVNSVHARSFMDMHVAREESLSKLGVPNWNDSEGYKKLSELKEEIDKLIEIISNDESTNKLVSVINKFYEHLDTLSILQESSILHILLFTVLTVTVLNILSVLFGIELIKYFKLEERMPKLAGFFRLRAQFQRYYLIWNVTILFTVCLFGIIVNLLLFTVK